MESIEEQNPHLGSEFKMIVFPWYTKQVIKMGLLEKVKREGWEISIKYLSDTFTQVLIKVGGHVALGLAKRNPKDQLNKKYSALLAFKEAFYDLDIKRRRHGNSLLEYEEELYSAFRFTPIVPKDL